MIPAMISTAKPAQAVKPISPLSWRSLQTRITLLTLLVFLVGLWSLSWYAVRTLHHDVQQLLSQQQLATVRLQAEDLNSVLAARLQTLQEAGKLAAPLMAGSRADLHTFLTTRLTLIKFFNSRLLLLGRDGQTLAAYPRSLPRPDGDVQVLGATRSALTEGRASIGTPEFSAQTGTPVLPFATPIRNPAGQVIGAMVGLIDLGQPNFLTPLLSSRYGQTGGYMLLAHPHRLHVAGTGLMQMHSDLPTKEASLVNRFFAPGATGSAVLPDTQGRPVLASAALLPATGWSLVATLPTAEAFDPVNNLIQRIQVAALLTSLLAVMLNWWLLHRQLRPMHTAFQALATQSRDGLAPQRLPTARNDEVGQLISSFNHLLDTLAQRENALQTSRADAHQALAQSQQLTKKLERYRFAMDEHVLFTISEVQGHITYANARFCEVSGYTLDELRQHDYSLLNSGVHPKDFFAGLYERVLAGKVWHGEVCNRAKGGQLFWLDMTVVPFVDDTGKTVEYITLNTDITERMASEAELQNYREHLEELVQQRTHDLHLAQTEAQAAALYARSLVEANVDPLFTISPQGKITDVNHATERISGMDRADLVGHDFAQYFIETERARQLHARVLRLGVVQDYPLTVRTLEGQAVTLVFNASVYKDNDDVVLGVFAAAHDVTALSQAKEAANAANQAKSSFLANMSHEIRTPMNGVVGMVDILQQTPLSADQRRMLGTIYQSSLALMDILNDILDYSKIEAGKLSVESIPTPLQEVVQGVVQLMQTAARAKALDLTLWVSPELPAWVFSDPTRLRQVLLNLIGNALKFTDTRPGHPGHVALRVASGRRANGQMGLYLRISDNGIGIAPEVLSQLFTPFTQADASTARQFGGTGLGLSISKRLVELMGGRIKARSTPGEGSEFTVELPLREAQGSAGGPGLAHLLATPATGTPDAPGAAQPSASTSARLILLAEDNETNRDVLQEQLHLLGYQAEVASDGAIALQMWQSRDYALLLTDCHMPNMDGFELTAAIRLAEGSGPRRPIIAVTANAMQGEAERCLTRGMDDYLSKPLRLQALRAMLQKWLPLTAGVPLVAADDPAAERPVTRAGVSLPVWDSLSLSEVVRGDQAMQQRLLAKYLINARTQMATLRRAAQAGELGPIASLAHNLKSASRTVGAMALGELCQQLEDSANAGDVALSNRLQERIPEAFSQAETRIITSLQIAAPTLAAMDLPPLSVNNQQPPST